MYMIICLTNRILNKNNKISSHFTKKSTSFVKQIDEIILQNKSDGGKHVFRRTKP